jgi:hypothetical protein
LPLDAFNVERKYELKIIIAGAKRKERVGRVRKEGVNPFSRPPFWAIILLVPTEGTACSEFRSRDIGGTTSDVYERQVQDLKWRYSW